MIHTHQCILEGQYITFPYLCLRAEAIVYVYPMTLYKPLVFEKISCHFGTWQPDQEASRAVVTISLYHSHQELSVFPTSHCIHTVTRKDFPEYFSVCVPVLPSMFQSWAALSVCRASSVQITHYEAFSKCKVNKHLQWIRVTSKPFQILHIRYELGSGKKRSTCSLSHLNTYLSHTLGGSYTLNSKSGLKSVLPDESRWKAW